VLEVSSIKEDLKNLLECLYYVSPAYNRLVQMLFLLPQKVRTLIGMYPDLMELEEELMALFSLEYTSEGFLSTRSHPVPLGYHLANLYHTLFGVLTDPDKRGRLLKLAGLSEEEFKKFDPLRAWIELSLDYLAKAEKEKDSLRLLSVIVEKLSGKGPNGYVSWEEIGKEANVKDLTTSARTLRQFFLLSRRESPYYGVYGRECLLLLDAYSDLRVRLKELLR